MIRDVRYAALTLLRSPIFTLTAMVALALAIGANAAIFGLVDALWFRPPGVRDPSSLVRVFATTPAEQQASWSFPEYLDLQGGVRSFDGVVARGRRGAMLASPAGTPELVLVNVVSTNFFTALGVSPGLGRVFTDDDQRSTVATVVLGHAFWQTRFGADPSIVGRTISLGRASSIPVTVLGVLPPAFRDLDAAADRDIWLPPFTWRQLSGAGELEDRASRWFEVFARLRPGVSAAAAHAETSALAGSFAGRFPAASARRGARVMTDRDYRLESGGANAAALLALVLLVIAITCVNVANLLLARSEGRAGELALRTALGAARWRIARQLMAESVLLGAMGAVAGLAIGTWLIHLLPAIMGTPPGFRSFLVFQTDMRVIAFTAGTTFLTTLLFGIGPSLLATRTEVGSVIKTGAGLSGSGRQGGAFGHALVVAQIAVSLVLLCSAGVLVRSFARTQKADLGFARTPVLTAWGASDDVPRETAVQAVRSLEALPGVRNVAVAIRAPLSLSGGGMAQPIYLPHAPAEPAAGLPSVKFNAVSTNFFTVMGTRLLRGRGFDELDQQGSTPAIVVNERFAAQFFPGREALTGAVRLGGATGIDHRIVGIAQNAVINGIGEDPEPYFYLPYWSQPHGEITFFLATTGDAALLAMPVRDTLRRLDTRLEPRRLITMREYIDHSASVYRTTALLASALGAIGLILTAIGVYGVIAYRMAKRSRELALRVAIGAAPGQVLSMTLREGLRVLLIGLAIGVPCALAVTRQMTSLLFGVRPWDTPAFAVSSALLLAVVGAAVLIPSIRATRVDPASLLRG